MAIAVAPTSLTPDVLHGHPSKAIPNDTYDEFIAPILKELHKFGITDPSSIQFDPSKHIIFTDDYFESTKKITLDELHVVQPHQTPLSNVGVSDPFPLFSDEAVAIMRYEMFQKDCFLHCARMADHTNTKGDLNIYVRGFVKDFAPFTKQAWNHPRTMEIISKMAEVELEHMFDYEIANSNVSIRQPSAEIVDASKEYEDPNDIPAILSWHFDSPQFVCVLMMSPTDDMIGGETSLLTGDGKVAKVDNPQKGWANVLQGRILKHVAPKPRGPYTERVTQVCSYRPKDPMLDKCVLTTIKPSQLAGTRYNEFYKEWMNYRLDVLTKRVEALKTQINTTVDKGDLFNQIETINFIQNNIVQYAEHTWQEFEVVDDGIVEKPASFEVVQARWD